MSNLDYRIFLQNNASTIINNNFQLYYGNCGSIEDISIKKYNKKTLEERNNALRDKFLTTYENYSKKVIPSIDIYSD
tara:strand:- start:5022 stop:5252 length:231 start_codon:yes stop_codon:yes gene_type:complete